jgi:hypothetical protein
MKGWGLGKERGDNTTILSQNCTISPAFYMNIDQNKPKTGLKYYKNYLIVVW